jgi:hypothetical protein
MPYVATNCWGPKHRISRILIDDSWDPTAASTQRTITCTTSLPVGTVAVAGFISMAGTVVNEIVGVREYGDSNNVASMRVQVASQVIMFPFEVQLDSSYRFDLYAGSSTISDVDTYLTGIYMG